MRATRTPRPRDLCSALDEVRGGEQCQGPGSPGLWPQEGTEVAQVVSLTIAFSLVGAVALFGCVVRAAGIKW
jgi:hypothetical protein